MPHIKKELSPKAYISTITEKKYIVIHGSNTRTEFSPLKGVRGNAQNLIDRWNDNSDKFSSPYIIERNGNIVQTYDDQYWSYHLNINDRYGVYDKMSIGIELLNENNLIKENGNYYINGYVHHQNIYTGPVIEKEFRGYYHYADLNKTQMASLLDLIKHLSSKHNIFPIWYDKYEFNKKVWDKYSIFTHSVVNDKVRDIPLNDSINAIFAKEFPSL